MIFGQREMSIIGHWPSSSRMPERYGRSVCASELLLRNTIIQRMAARWGIAAAYFLLSTLVGRVRIGKSDDEAPTVPHHPRARQLTVARATP